GERLLDEKMISFGQREVNSPEECDYLLVFCPAVSRVGTDITDALSNLPFDLVASVLTGSKPMILVVMHHTINPHYVVSKSQRQVNNGNVHLTVDCLFYEDKLLNSGAWNCKSILKKILNFLFYDFPLCWTNTISTLFDWCRVSQHHIMFYDSGLRRDELSGLCVWAGGGEDPNAGLVETGFQLKKASHLSFIAGKEQNINRTMNAENRNTQAGSKGTTRH
uniref:Uncharacterized protein n=1 Tax=Haplochromis burtoni TaxID=8153 RepID=A0A3Q2W4M9_HAPBU